MSESEDDSVDELLAYSGSEYNPSSGGESDISSYSDDDINSDSDQGISRKRKRTGNVANYTRQPRNIRDGKGSSNQNTQVLTPNGRLIYKPFCDFMRGTVFCLSGFVNPLRSELRNKALEMGARYEPDWNDSCTHLICAFRNTPKYTEVRGKGKIVKKEWIEECYSSRKRFSWRRFALDRRDCFGLESEDEIHEDDSTNSTSTVLLS